MYLDDNECATNKGGCDHTCLNTNGSYVCACMDGYELDEDQHGCSGMFMMQVLSCIVHPYVELDCIFLHIFKRLSQ